MAGDRAIVKSIFVYPIKSCRGISVPQAPLSSTVIRASGMDPLKVPLGKRSAIADGISVWEWSGSAFDEGDEASNWFSSYIGKPGRLVRFNQESEIRNVDPDYAPRYKIMFSDQYPFLIASQGSLEAIKQSSKGAGDLWKEIRVNKLTFNGIKLCSRCKEPSINKETAIAGSELTETLKRFRSDQVLRPSKKPQGATVTLTTIIFSSLNPRPSWTEDAAA